jgi:N-acetylglucosaminyldiphosphoundecaprenol N-acetyl-beta-D-mannosaminyltransferase
MTSAVVQTANLLGVGVSAVNPISALQEIGRWIAQGEHHYVCVTGVHGIMESHRDPKIKAHHNGAGMVIPDGMPMVWWLKLAGYRHADRVCGPEFMPYLLNASQRPGWRHFLYGATDETLAVLRAKILDEFPGVQIVGSYAPPFRPLTAEEDAEVIRRINDSGADIVWVGLSTPKQERWMAEHSEALHAAALIGVGAAFDMQAGLIDRAPAFLRRTGFEWAYRLILEPRRLWRRYLRNNPAFLCLAAAQLGGLMHFPLEGAAEAGRRKASLRVTGGAHTH